MYKYCNNGIGFLITGLCAQIDMEHTASIWHLFTNGVSISCAGVAIIRVWAAYIRVWAAIIRVQPAYTPRILGVVGVCTAPLPCTDCVMYARRSHGDFFSMFKIWWRTCRACLAHIVDSTAYVWRTQSVNEDPWAYVAYLPRAYLLFFFVHRSSAVASPAGGTGA